MSEEDHEWEGCHGEHVSYQEFEQFLEDAFLADDADEKAGGERYATCVWGHTGLGKTSNVKQFSKKPVKWEGKQYDGYDVRTIPIAQFEEMGDLHGVPAKHIKVVRDNGTHRERWVAVEVVKGYTSQGWQVDHEAGMRTMYAPPEWVPTEPGPCIMVLDDFNRAGGRIIKGCMQFLQEYGLMSWKLPPGCHIVLTANPDGQDYFVTSIDSAVLQRFRSCTLKFDAKEWAVWAEAAGIDGRVTSFVLAYPEMACSSTAVRTSPRSLSELGRFLSVAGAVGDRRLHVMAKSLLDDDTVTSLVTFIDRDFEMVVGPEDIIQGKPFVYDHLKDIMTREEKRIDVMGVTCNRLYAYLCRKDLKPEREAVLNVQKFLTSKWVEPEMRYILVDRLNRASEKDPKMDQWFLGNKELMKLIMDSV